MELYNKFFQLINYAPKNILYQNDEIICDNKFQFLKDKCLSIINNNYLDDIRTDMILYINNDDDIMKYFNKTLPYECDDLLLISRNNNMAYYKRQNRNSFTLVTINNKIPNEYLLTDDLQLWYSMIDDNIKNTINKFGIEILSLNNITAADIMLYTITSENLHFKKSNELYINEYFKIIIDKNSISNRYGGIYLNLGVNSDTNIYCYSSDDDGILSIVASSFSNFIKLMINWLEIKNETPKIECLSLCDHLNCICECYEY